jgi:hypothetical protein
MLGTITQPLIDGLTALQRMFKLTVQNIIIGLLLAQIAWFKFQISLDNGIAALKENFPNAVKAVKAIGTAIDELWQLVKGVFGSEWKELLAAAALVLTVTVAPAIWAAATAMWGFAAGVLAATWPVLATIAGVYLLIKAFEFLYTLMETEDLAAAAVDMFGGLIAGVWKAGKLFVNAIIDIGKAGIAGFKAIFKMKSPSKVMAELGINVVQGLEQGVTKESDSAQAAIAGAGGDPAAALGRDPAAGVPAGAARSSGTAVNIATLNVQVGGKASTEDARNIAQSIKRELEAILQTVAVQTGATLA